MTQLPIAINWDFVSKEYDKCELTTPISKWIADAWCAYDCLDWSGNECRRHWEAMNNEFKLAQ